MQIEDIDLPDKHSTYNHSERGRARRGEYRKRTGRYTTTNKYLAKPFIGVDGESFNNDDGSQTYFKLGLSNGLSIRNEAGLSTMEILTFLSRNLPESKHGIPVMYGGGYDFNFWIKDLPERTLRTIYDGSYRDKPVQFGAYSLRWQLGKSFSIRSGGGKLVTINDISPFFQTSFIEALDEWLGDYEGRDLIAEGKAARGAFSREDMEWIEEYNAQELPLIVELATVLRERFERVGIRPRRWTGPGNAVVTLFRRHDIKSHMDKAIPDYVAQAARYAYAGGRIEMVHFGSVSDRPSFQYDINAAYPEAIAELPSLAGGQWVYRAGDPGDYPFSLYKVSTHAANARHPNPMFNRGAQGVISFPMHTHNWVWSPEMVGIREWAEVTGGTYHVTEAITFEPASNVKPFAWLRELYQQRQELKANGDPAELAVKTVMAAVYGKLGQQLGFIAARGRRAAEIPPYHQLEWAGYITSYTRAKLFRAALKKPSSVIAFETDALFTMEPLDLPIGSGLGEWKVTEYRSLTYVQSGIYSGERADGERVNKVRGFSAEWLTPEAISEALDKPEQSRLVTTHESRFIGLGIALQIPGFKLWRHWVEQERVLRCFPLGKRIHYLCPCGVDDHGPLVRNMWHHTTCPVREQISREYPVLWINPDPELQRLADMRKAISEWD